MDLHPEKRRDLGRRVEVFWDADGQYYRAVVVAYHPTSKKHTIMYEDGGREKLNLDEVPHRWAPRSMDVWHGGCCCWQPFRDPAKRAANGSIASGQGVEVA